MIPSTRHRFLAPWFLALGTWLFAVTPGTSPLVAQTQPPTPARYALAIHGGVGTDPAKWTPEQRDARTRSLTAALRIGQRILAEGGSSLDAVERVIRQLEDDPVFNAGRGAVLNAEGHHELDASIMDGRDRSCGAVTGVTTVRHPISLARLVMTRTRHVLLAGTGAEQFAEKMGVEQVAPDWFTTDHARRGWEEARRQQNQPVPDDRPKGTVGCVALDSHGNLAAGTSTGGLTYKMPGRIGDSPIVGAGTYADNGTCAVSCTGVGEHFIRHVVAHDISARMAYRGDSLADAVRHVVHQTLKPGDGGVIAVDRQGQIVLEFNTPGMSRGAADSSGRFTVDLGR
ncbi:MAG: isoaspartyl peptidase/L-asparaginase [Pirellulaceae bacterium]|nr:isoaspartyl peptidase/L-asparaginase [Pirellulaceae bacterium]